MNPLKKNISNINISNIKKNIRLTSTILFLLMITCFVSADVLVNTSIDKNQISINEVAFFNVNLFNNSSDIENYPIRIETSDNLILLENEDQILFDIIDEINEGRTKEIKLRIKAINSKDDIGKVFIYHGSNYQYASGTIVSIKENNVNIKTSAEKNNTKEGDKIFLNFEINNKSGKPIQNIGVEAIAPNGFIIRSQPLFIPILDDNNNTKYEFEILAPLETNGEQKFFLAYGFFDENGPHYFEESFDISFEKKDNKVLAGIGIMILIVAVFFYINSSKKEKDVKGTE